MREVLACNGTKEKRAGVEKNGHLQEPGYRLVRVRKHPLEGPLTLDALVRRAPTVREVVNDGSCEDGGGKIPCNQRLLRLRSDISERRC